MPMPISPIDKMPIKGFADVEEDAIVLILDAKLEIRFTRLEGISARKVNHWIM